MIQIIRLNNKQLINFSLTFAQQFVIYILCIHINNPINFIQRPALNMQNSSNRSLDNENALKAHQKSVAAVYKERRRIMEEINDK